MAKNDPHEPAPHPHEPPKPPPPAPPPAPPPVPKAPKKPKATHTVTFAGQPPVEVTAASDEEAVEMAKEELGIVSSEKPPDVVKVP